MVRLREELIEGILIIMTVAVLGLLIQTLYEREKAKPKEYTWKLPKTYKHKPVKNHNHEVRKPP
jgi:hypothetical protein